MKYPKAEIVRSKSYLRWVASLPCVCCGIEGRSQAAHANSGKGMSMKTSDLDTFPLCADGLGYVGCHTMHDRPISLSRALRREREPVYIAKTRALAVEVGRKELK